MYLNPLASNLTIAHLETITAKALEKDKWPFIYVNAIDCIHVSAECIKSIAGVAMPDECMEVMWLGLGVNSAEAYWLALFSGDPEIARSQATTGIKEMGHSVSLCIASKIPTPKAAIAEAIAQILDVVAFARWIIDDALLASWDVSAYDSYDVATFPEGPEVVFPDENLDAVIRSAINKPTGTIVKDDLKSIYNLRARYKNIVNLSGIEHCVNLTDLDLEGNKIQDISLLAELPKLKYLSLKSNTLKYISSFENMTAIIEADLSYNDIDIFPSLSKLKDLKVLDASDNNLNNIVDIADALSLTDLELDGNHISNISPLSALTQLTHLNLGRNEIKDLTPLSNMVHLQWLHLRTNHIDNIFPLIQMAEINSSITFLTLDENCLDTNCEDTGNPDCLYIDMLNVELVGNGGQEMMYWKDGQGENCSQ